MKLASIRQHGAKKKSLIVMLNKQGREVLYIDVLHQICLIFDVYPGKTLVKMLFLQGVKLLAVSRTGVAPGCAQADY